MKKIWNVLAAVIVVLTSCSDEEVVNNKATQSRIQATLEQGSSSSRMSIGEGNLLAWTVGDAFTMIGSTNEIWSLIDGGGESFAEFGGYVPDNLVGAAFPANAGYSLFGEKLSFTLPDTYTYVANVCNLPMWAPFSDWDSGIEFKHLCALLKVTVNDIPEGFKTMVVETDKQIAGSFVADISKDIPMLEINEGDENTKRKITITFNAINEGADDNDRVFYLPLPPNEYDFIKVTISNGTKDLVLKEWNDKTIVRKKVYTASLTNIVSEATTPDDVSLALGNLSAEAPKVTMTMTEEIDATQGDEIKIPVLDGTTTEVVMNFEKAPNTTAAAPLTITESESSTTSDEETNDLVISISDNENKKIYLTVETPQSTVTVKQGNFATIIATTASNTFIVNEDVIIENLIVKAGNVIVRGEITGSVTRHESNTDKETIITVDGGIVPEITDESILVVDSKNALIKNEELSVALQAVLGEDVVSINAHGYAEIAKSFADTLSTLNFNVNCSISSLKGIENFPNLSYLRCYNVGLTGDVKLTKNKKLEYLNVGRQAITSLDLSGLSLLSKLVCGSCQNLTTLILDGCDNLTDLNIAHSAFTAIPTIPSPEKLNTLYLGGSSMTSIDLSRFTNLDYLSMECQDLNEMPLLPAPEKLFSLYASCNFSTIDLSAYTSLQKLDVHKNPLTSLDISKNTALVSLDCQCCKLSKLDISQNPLLENLICGNQQDELVLSLTLSDAQKEKWDSTWKNYASNDRVELHKHSVSEGSGTTGGDDFNGVIM